MPLISSRMSLIRPSPTLTIASKVRELKASGHKIIDLGIGEPDLLTPANIKAKALWAIAANKTRYTDVAGVLPLRKAISERYKLRKNLDFRPEEVIVSAGAKQSLFNTMMATLEEGDEVVIPAPFWVSYIDIVSLFKAHPIVIETTYANDFKITALQLKASITSRTKWLILNSPSNPTGMVYSKQELKDLAEVLLDYPDIHILSDDIYEDIVFGSSPCYNILQVEPKLGERVLIISGVSKTYCMTGWRIGYALSHNRKLIESMAILQSQSTSNASSIAQEAAIEALTGPQDIMKEHIAILERRQAKVISAINNIEGLSCKKPDGTFYVFVNCADIFGKMLYYGQVVNSSEELAEYLLDKALVAVIAGSAFGMEGFFRISYAVDDNSLEQALAAITLACKISA